METQTQLSQNYHEVLCWLRGGDTTSNPDMENRFIDVMASLVKDRIERDEQKQREETAKHRAERRANNSGSNLSLRAIVNECIEKGEIEGTTYEELMGIRKKDECSPATEKKESTPSTPEENPDGVNTLDSVAVGKALCHIGKMDRRNLNMSQVQIIMYISYGVWLANTGKRLTMEHPQMWQFGPVFPRAYNKLRKDPSEGKVEYDALMKEHPEIVGFLKEQYQRFGFTRANVVTAPHLASGTPWAKARKKSPDKWGATIEDSDINSWFRARIR